jgi:hypothetical protein
MEQKPQLMAFENRKPVEQEQSMQVPTMGKDEQDTQDQTDIFIG